MSLLGRYLSSSSYLDSGCSRHMTGEMSMFLDLKPSKGSVSYGSGKDKIIGVGRIGKNSLPTINDVTCVEGLKYNLLSISQFRDNGYVVSFNKDEYIVRRGDQTILFTGIRKGNLYEVNLEDLSKQNVTCLMTTEDERDAWHRKLGHLSLKYISKLSKKELVKGLPKISWKTHLLCESCQKGKQLKASFKSKNVVSTSRPLELLHMDLFGPTKTPSLGGKKYGFIIIDDYSRFTWVYFLAHKHESFKVFEYSANVFKMKKIFA